MQQITCPTKRRRTVSKVRIRRVTRAHQVEEMDLIAFGPDEATSFTGHYLWVAEVDGALAGYAALQLVDGGKAAFLSRCGVLPGYRGKGLQAALIKVRERFARKLGIKTVITYTTVTNLGSANSLIKCGYKLYRPAYDWGFKWGHGLYWHRGII
jgi:GNAT superfamily N-acetyltransferase